MLQPGAPGRIRPGAARAAARIIGRQSEPAAPAVRAARERVARFVEPLLLDADQRTREAAVGILGEVGDARSIAALEAVRRREPIKRHQDAASASIQRIRSRAAPAEPGENATEARLRAMEDRLDAVEKALDEADGRH